MKKNSRDSFYPKSGLQEYHVVQMHDMRKPLQIPILAALLIAVFHFAPFFPHLVAATLGLARETPAISTDFPSFYAAAQAYSAGANPYDLMIVDAASTELRTKVFPFLYPPVSLPIFWLLSFAGFADSLLGFQIVSFVSLVLLTFIVLDTAEIEAWPREWRIVAIVALMAFDAISTTFQNGQVNLIATAAVLCAWRCARKGRVAIACAIALLVATLLKVLPVLLIIPFLVRRDWKVVSWFALLLGSTMAVAWVTVSPDVWRAWMSDVLPSGHFGETPWGLFPPSDPRNQSLNGALSRLLGEAATAEIGNIVQLGVLGLTVLALSFRLRDDRTNFYDFAFGIMTCATFLVAPLSWMHHYVFLIPTLVCFASLLNRARPVGPVWIVGLLLTTVAVSVEWPLLLSANSLTQRLIMTLPIVGPAGLMLIYFVWSMTNCRASEALDTKTVAVISRREQR